MFTGHLHSRLERGGGGRTRYHGGAHRRRDFVFQGGAPAPYIRSLHGRAMTHHPTTRLERERPTGQGRCGASSDAPLAGVRVGGGVRRGQPAGLLIGLAASYPLVGDCPRGSNAFGAQPMDGRIARTWAQGRIGGISKDTTVGAGAGAGGRTR